MKPQSEKPVFFFDIDNCVGIHELTCGSKTTNHIVALSKEFVTLYIITWHKD
jgi:hypothetical protein